MAQRSEERQCPHCDYYGLMKELDNKELEKSIDFSTAPDEEFARFFIRAGIFYQYPNCSGRVSELADALAIFGVYVNIKESEKEPK